MTSRKTEPIVSAAALALIDAGKLRLDDPVARWLPAFAPRLADGRTPAITVRQLLPHTAGISYNVRSAVYPPPRQPDHLRRPHAVKCD